MTHFNDHNMSRVTPRLTAEDDDLDYFLNTHLTSDGPPDASERFDVHDLDSLSVSASEFHRRMEAAQDRNLQASQPAPNLWERILDKREIDERETEMSSPHLALDNRPIDTFPVPGSQARLNRSRGDISRWTNMVIAVVLIVAIGVGYWFSGFGPGGGRGDDSQQYAVLGLTPGVSPDMSATGCNIDPLTTDQVMEIVRNPLIPLNEMGAVIAASPAPLLEADDPGLGGLPESELETSTPTEEEFAGINAAASAYYNCLSFGTNFQLWAIVAPNVVQTWILGNFPVFRDEATIRAWVEEVGPQSAEQHFPDRNLLAGFINGDYRIEPDPDRTNAVLVDAGRNEDPRLVWVGMRVVRNSDRKIVSLANARPTSPRVGNSGEVLLLMQWPGADAWFVTGITGVTWVE